MISPSCTQANFDTIGLLILLCCCKTGDVSTTACRWFGRLRKGRQMREHSQLQAAGKCPSPKPRPKPIQLLAYLKSAFTPSNIPQVQRPV